MALLSHFVKCICEKLGFGFKEICKNLEINAKFFILICMFYIFYIPKIININFSKLFI